MNVVHWIARLTCYCYCFSTQLHEACHGVLVNHHRQKLTRKGNLRRSKIHSILYCRTNSCKGMCFVFVCMLLFACWCLLIVSRLLCRVCMTSPFLHLTLPASFLHSSTSLRTNRESRSKRVHQHLPQDPQHHEPTRRMQLLPPERHGQCSLLQAPAVWSSSLPSSLLLLLQIKINLYYNKQCCRVEC